MGRVVIVFTVALVGAAPAAASELITRAASHVRLNVAADGRRALVTYKTRGRTVYVTASGAINARQPSRARRQVKFRLAYSSTRPPFARACPQPAFWVFNTTASCTRAGSNWTVQTWMRALPNFGVTPSVFRLQPELRLSHWTGQAAKLTLRADWAYGGQWDHLYGKLTYRGHPVHGFGSTSVGVPTDTYGRNVYLDTLNSAYGDGWRRENGFLTHNPAGVFCYTVSPHRDSLTGKGTAYRATVIGPGVTPDVRATVDAPGPYDPARDAALNEDQRVLFDGDQRCKINRRAAVSEIPDKPACTRGAVLLCLVDYARKVNHVPLVSGSNRLHNAAGLKAQRIIECGQFAHDPCGENPFLVFVQAGWICGICGENIAWGYTSQRAVMAAWLASPGHRANILNPTFTNVGHSSRYYLNGARLWTEDFGTR